MKQLEDLTKRQRREYERSNGVYKLGVLQVADTDVKYIIENNSKEEIASFLKKAYVTGEASKYLTSVYVYNRLYEHLHDLPRAGHGLNAKRNKQRK